MKAGVKTHICNKASKIPQPPDQIWVHEVFSFGVKNSMGLVPAQSRKFPLIPVSFNCTLQECQYIVEVVL